MRKILGVLILLTIGLSVRGFCVGAGAGNPDVYHIGASSGIAISSYTLTNVFSINASTTYAVNIDNMKFWCDDNATVLVALSSQVSGGYNAVIATTRPIGQATKNLFTSSCAVVCSSTTQSVGTSFRVLANHKCEYNELGGKIQIPKGWSLVFIVQADTATSPKFYGQFRVWE